MSVKTFNYKKSNGERSERKVVVTEDNSDHIIGIDYSHLSASKQSMLNRIIREGDTLDTSNFSCAIRRFQKNNMTRVKDATL